MTTPALLMMLITMCVVTLATCTFFYKVLATPPKPVELPDDKFMDLSK